MISLTNLKLALENDTTNADCSNVSESDLAMTQMASLVPNSLGTWQVSKTLNVEVWRYTKVYFTSLGPSKNCPNLFILHLIFKMLTPLEFLQLSASDDILH